MRAKLAGIGEAGETVVGRGARHRDGAFGQSVQAIALQIIGRDDGLLASDDDAQAEVVAFRALGFFDGAVAHLDGQRDRTNRERIGLIGAGAARGIHEAFGELGEVGLIEKGLHFLAGLCGKSGKHKLNM